MKSRPKQLVELESSFRRSGLKITHQRLEIYRELSMATDHPTAEMLYRRLRDRLPTISLDTVYRNLITLENHGLVNKVGTTESLARFDAKKEKHHHLFCRKCGMITDFDLPLINEVSLPDEINDWGKIEKTNLVLYGICKRCLKTN
jgi:Fur family peroxide stress response transcriptional regulator